MINTDADGLLNQIRARAKEPPAPPPEHFFERNLPQAPHILHVPHPLLALRTLADEGFVVLPAITRVPMMPSYRADLPLMVAHLIRHTVNQTVEAGNGPVPQELYERHNRFVSARGGALVAIDAFLDAENHAAMADRLAWDTLTWAGTWDRFMTAALSALPARNGNRPYFVLPFLDLHPRWERRDVCDLLEGLGGERISYVLEAKH